jgi:NADPH2:quinone reductase
MPLPATGLQLQHLLTPDAELKLGLAPVPIPKPADDEVVIRIEAAPINPSDVRAMIGPADISQMRVEGTGDATRLAIPFPPDAMRGLAGRVGKAMPAGIEGAGVVVAAGASPRAQELIGRVVAVAMFGGGMYAEYRVARIADLLVTKAGTTPAEAASSFVNPLTALAMVETLYREGHGGLVHTAAASNLGQMLNRLCIADGIPLVNIVRRESQAQLLKEMGAAHVALSTSASFIEDLKDSIAATNATLCFDAVGGGELVSQILDAMEAVQRDAMGAYDRHGSALNKQVFIYGLLAAGPTLLTHSYGSAWGVNGWLLPQFLARIGPAAAGRLKNRVANELTTTFASHYTRTISLREALDPDTIKAYCRHATGEKYLIAPLYAVSN